MTVKDAKYNLHTYVSHQHGDRKDCLHNFYQEIDTDRIEAELAMCVFAHVHQHRLQACKQQICAAFSIIHLTVMQMSIWSTTANSSGSQTLCRLPRCCTSVKSLAD